MHDIALLERKILRDPDERPGQLGSRTAARLRYDSFQSWSSGDDA
jgi:hypothetical protein